MWRLAWAMVVSLALLSCDGGDTGIQAPVAPSPLMSSSPVSELVARYEASQDTYASVRGEVVSQSIEGEFREAVWYEQPRKWRTELSGELRDLGSLKAGHVRVSTGSNFFLAWEPGRRFCQMEPGEQALAQKIDVMIVGFPGALDLSKAEIQGEATVAGRPTLKVVIDPEIPHRLVWIDSVYGMVVAYENDTETSAVQRSEFTNISFNDNLDEDLFQPAIAGYTERPCEEIVNY